MCKTRIIGRAAALAIAAAVVALSVSGSVARTAYYVRCTGTPPEYSPGDLLYKQAGVSASARLALAIRWREYWASCHRVAVHRHHHSG